MTRRRATKGRPAVATLLVGLAVGRAGDVASDVPRIQVATVLAREFPAAARTWSVGVARDAAIDPRTNAGEPAALAAPRGHFHAVARSPSVAVRGGAMVVAGVAVSRLDATAAPQAEPAGLGWMGPSGAPHALTFVAGAAVEDLLFMPTEAPVGYRFALPAGWRLHEVAGANGLAEVRDERGVSRLHVRGGLAWDAAGNQLTARATVRGETMEWSVPAQVRRPVLVDPSFEDAGTLLFPRNRHSMTLLPDGQVLVCGGFGANNQTVTAELYDPSSSSFAAAANLLQPREGFTATRLASGRVLIAGGSLQSLDVSVEVYDPATRRFEPAGELVESRSLHSATLLPSGKVLLVGGFHLVGGSGKISETAELYDPDTGTSTTVGAATPRAAHTATLLPTGDVLLAGGVTGQVEVIDAATAAVKSTHPVTSGLIQHTATSLPSGKILLVGGTFANSAPAVHLYDPWTDELTAGPPTSKARYGHQAIRLPDGRVLLVGGASRAESQALKAQDYLDTAEIYDERAGAFAPAGRMSTSRANHAALLLPVGKVLVTGGVSGAGATLATAEVFEPELGQLERSSFLTSPRVGHTATPLPGGRVLMAGGEAALGRTTTAAEEYADDPRGYATTGGLSQPRARHAATPLPGGRVLITGGDSDGAALSSSEIYDAATRRFAAHGALSRARSRHTATALSGGAKVLVVGGDDDGPLSSAELYDAATGAFSVTGALSVARWGHTATEVAPGVVVVAGGWTADPKGALVATRTAELFDLATGTFTPLPDLVAARSGHSATALPSGRVLLAGGEIESGAAVMATEVFDTVTKTFSAGPALVAARVAHAAAALPADRVLLTGGRAAAAGTSPFVDSTEIVDVSLGVSKPSAKLAVPRANHTATRLDGTSRVLVAGGITYDKTLLISQTADIIDGAGAGALTPTLVADAQQLGYASTLLPSGRVLLAGGRTYDGVRVDLLTLFDPTSGVAAPVGHLSRIRDEPVALLVDPDHVLIAGGFVSGKSVVDPPTGDVTETTELFAISTETSAAGPPMSVARASFTATRLPSGVVLLAGGLSSKGQATAVAELWTPGGSAISKTGGLAQARYGHTATLLPSGKVLISGGRRDGQPVTTAELYDPTSGTFAPTSLVFPASASATMMNGQALLVGSGTVGRVSGDALSLSLGDGPAAPVAAVPLVNGDTAVLARERSSFVSPLTPARRPFTDGPMSSLVRGTTGGLVGTVYGAVRYEPRPAGAQRPELEAVPSSILTAQTVALTGRRFSRRAGATLDGDMVDPTLMPVVAFMPIDASGGGPIFGETLSWSDDAISWRAPRTVFLGPGLLHVYVDGTWSDGAFTRLVGQPGAGACTFDGECVSGHCSEGVCCDRACTGGCESCLAKNRAAGALDGACGPIVAGGPPRSGCEADATTCGPLGTCDGAASCTFPDQRTRCQTTDGAVGGCVAGICKDFAARCDASGHAYVDASGVTVDCGAAACRDGKCLSSCVNHADCAPAHGCSSDGVCRPATSAGDAADPGLLCAARRIGPAQRWSWALIAVAASVAARRRRGAIRR